VFPWTPDITRNSKCNSFAPAQFDIVYESVLSMHKWNQFPIEMLSRD